jgi:hypothetical protein
MSKVWRWVDICLIGAQYAVWMAFAWKLYRYGFQSAVDVGSYFWLWAVIQWIRSIPKIRFKLWIQHCRIRWRTILTIWGPVVLLVLMRPILPSMSNYIFNSDYGFVLFLAVIVFYLIGAVCLGDWWHDRATNCLRTPLEKEMLANGELRFSLRSRRPIQ